MTYEELTDDQKATLYTHVEQYLLDKAEGEADDNISDFIEDGEGGGSGLWDYQQEAYNEMINTFTY